MATTALDTQPKDVADKAFALQAAGRLPAAAHEFARAADLYQFERDLGTAADMIERATTCRRASRVRRHAVSA